MHLDIVATDLDGTLAEHGQIAPETWEELHRARAAGLTLLLVTGRRLETFAPEGPYAEIFDAIVAEDGAVVYFPQRDAVVLPFGRLAPTLVAHIEALDLPLERGVAILATRVPYDAAVTETLRIVGGGATIEYNKGAVMVVPPGATKGTGLAYALHELSLSPRNVVACGDAENDRSMFELAELSVAVANATPDIKAVVDLVLPAANGIGMRALLADLAAGRAPERRPRHDRRLLVGHGSDGAPVALDPWRLLDGNIAIVGSSASGKSWIGGKLAEEMLRQGYQIAVIDPEGDYRGLRVLPHTLALGGPGAPLPPVADAVALAEYADLSLLLDLSATTEDERAAYITGLLHALGRLRAERGRPHWLLLDEVQNLSLGDGALAAVVDDALAPGGVGIVTYRPSQVPPPILRHIDQWLLLRLSAPEEVAALDEFMADCAPWPELRDKLPTLPLGQAQLCDNQQEPAARAMLFRIGSRSVPHVRHLHKYLRAALPREKRFFFRDETGTSYGAAANLWEFQEALVALPISSLRYHLQRGDFARWVGDTLRDDFLARRLRKLASRDLDDTSLREALVTTVVSRYDELVSMI